MHLVGNNPNYNPRRVWFAYAMLVLMNAIDVVYTHSILFVGDFEANPLMYFVYQHYGIVGIALAKIIFLALLGYGLEYFSTIRPIFQKAFYLCVAAYGLLTLYHGYWLFIYYGWL